MEATEKKKNDKVSLQYLQMMEKREQIEQFQNIAVRENKLFHNTTSQTLFIH